MLMLLWLSHCRLPFPSLLPSCMDANMTTGLPSHVDLGSCSNSYCPTQRKGSGWFMAGEAILGVVMAPTTVCRCEEVIPNDLFGHYSLRKLEAASARQRGGGQGGGGRTAEGPRTLSREARGKRKAEEDGGRIAQRLADAQRRGRRTHSAEKQAHSREADA